MAHPRLSILRLARPLPAVIAAAVLGELLVAPALPAAADEPVNLTVDGRPVSSKPDVAVMRNGVMYVDAVDFTKVFNGLLVTSAPGAIKIAVRGHTAAFHSGERSAVIDGKHVTLEGPAFTRNGDVYIPIKTILYPHTTITMRSTGKDAADLHVSVFGSGKKAVSAMAEMSNHVSPASALTLEPTAHVSSDGLHVSVSVRNHLSVPYTLTFPTGGRAAFVIDRDGTTVWDSARGRVYTQSISHLTLAPGESVTYADVWPGWSSQASGRYQIRVRLMVSPPLLTSPSSLGVVAPGSS